ncbi:unnamed protein product [Psylliodes chrysocephalus]|uniref:Uncharacterized protein n=1 Tax=Psylliodes chrysocephalus TaxID=3402493 RepID=A0A9P0CKY5_9CUCU|nr:unnamed protein product [Psylliodes chrysocephala]
MMTVDIFNFSLIMYPLANIRILKHIFKNYDKYVSKVKIQCGYDDATARFVTIRECILLHKEIIKYVDDYNFVLSNVSLLDYLQSSLEFATIILQMNNENSFYSVFFVTTCGLCAISRLFIFYLYADQLTFEASGIGQAAFESNWYEQPKEIKQMVITIIMRCNKEVSLSIGPFDKMSLKTFVVVSKIAIVF